MKFWHQNPLYTVFLFRLFFFVPFSKIYELMFNYGVNLLVFNGLNYIFFEKGKFVYSNFIWRDVFIDFLFCKITLGS
jgi:hypothetical protein